MPWAADGGASSGQGGGGGTDTPGGLGNTPAARGGGRAAERELGGEAHRAEGRPTERECKDGTQSHASQPAAEEGRETSSKATEPDEHNGGAAGGTAAETGRVCAWDRSGWRGGRPAAAVPFVDTASLTRRRCSPMWLQRNAAGRSVGAPVGRPHPPSGYPPQRKSERWRLYHSVTAQHAAHARTRTGAAGGGVGRLVHQTGGCGPSGAPDGPPPPGRRLAVSARPHRHALAAVCGWECAARVRARTWRRLQHPSGERSRGSADSPRAPRGSPLDGQCLGQLASRLFSQKMIRVSERVQDLS